MFSLPPGADSEGRTAASLVCSLGPAEVAKAAIVCNNTTTPHVRVGQTITMQTVTRFEANLLRLLYYFLRQEPAERALPLVEQRIDPPPCLSRTTIRLVQDALAKGCTFLIAS